MQRPKSNERNGVCENYELTLLTSVGKSSPIKVQGTTRTPNELQQTYPSIQIKRIVYPPVAIVAVFCSKYMKMAAASVQIPIPIPEQIKNFRRPKYLEKLFQQ